jgi:hypothetical protein
MKPFAKYVYDRFNLCRKIIAVTDEFLRQSSRHNLAGLKELVDIRRDLLLALGKTPIPTSLSREHANILSTLSQRIDEQGATIEAITRRLQLDIVNRLDEIHRAKAMLKNYKSRFPKPSKFVDKVS